jgi:hypothetical protein
MSRPTGYASGQFFTHPAVTASATLSCTTKPVALAAAFPTHFHQDMEIITWISSGAMDHTTPNATTPPCAPGYGSQLLRYSRRVPPRGVLLQIVS